MTVLNHINMCFQSGQYTPLDQFILHDLNLSNVTYLSVIGPGTTKISEVALTVMEDCCFCVQTVI